MVLFWFDVGILDIFGIDADGDDDEEEEEEEEVKNPAWMSARVSEIVIVGAESVEIEEAESVIVGDVGLAWRAERYFSTRQKNKKI